MLEITIDKSYGSPDITIFITRERDREIRYNVSRKESDKLQAKSIANILYSCVPCRIVDEVTRILVEQAKADGTYIEGVTEERK